MYTAKKPPPSPPSRARGRSMWPSVLRSKNDRPVLTRLRTVSLWPSKIGGYGDPVRAMEASFHSGARDPCGLGSGRVSSESKPPRVVASGAGEPSDAAAELAEELDQPALANLVGGNRARIPGHLRERGGPPRNHRGPLVMQRLVPAVFEECENRLIDPRDDLPAERELLEAELFGRGLLNGTTPAAKLFGRYIEVVESHLPPPAILDTLMPRMQGHPDLPGSKEW